MKKTMLVVTGPQGSGNHLFSKVLALHPDVMGWKDLLKHYWIGHDNEPFARLWHSPSMIGNQVWDKKHYVTSISCPYIYDGKRCIPDYHWVIDEFEKVGFRVKVAVIGRDQNILHNQQERVRGESTLHHFTEQMESLARYHPTFMSTELLYLYRNHYLQALSKELGFPIDYNNPKLEEILVTDPNAKYFNEPIGPQPLDEQVKYASLKKQEIE